MSTKRPKPTPEMQIVYTEGGRTAPANKDAAALRRKKALDEFERRQQRENEKKYNDS